MQQLAEVFLKHLSKLTGKYLCWSLPLLSSDTLFFQNKPPTQLLYCEFHETFKNIIFTKKFYK